MLYMSYDNNIYIDGAIYTKQIIYLYKCHYLIVWKLILAKHMNYKNLNIMAS